jgi:hypothetical protein
MTNIRKAIAKLVFLLPKGYENFKEYVMMHLNNNNVHIT